MQPLRQFVEERGQVALLRDRFAYFQQRFQLPSKMVCGLFRHRKSRLRRAGSALAE